MKVPLLASGDLEETLGAGFSTDQSFTGSTTGSTSNSHQGEFELAVPVVPSNLGYAFGAAYYYGTDGAARVTYGTDVTADAASREFWLRAYGQKPDPALNLPNATVLLFNGVGYLGSVKWNPGQSRQKLRGFTPRLPDGGDPTTSGAPYAQSPEAGDPVVFDVDVSNYSLEALTEPLTVEFMAVPTDEDGLDPIGDPVPIGTTTLTGGIGAQQQRTVSSPEWTAQPSSTGEAQNWRIFVVLDPDDTVEEVHEWQGSVGDRCPGTSVQGGFTLTDPMTGEPETLACGQNNQGYGTISVMPEGASSVGAEEGAEVALVGAGVVTGDRDSLRLDESSTLPEVRVGEPSTVVIRAEAQRHTPSHQVVMIYDGNPAEGDLVAVKRLEGVPGDGQSAVAFEYTPTREGVTELHAVLLSSDDTSGDRGLIVRVDAAPMGDVGGGSVEGSVGSAGSMGSAGSAQGSSGSVPGSTGSRSSSGRAGRLRSAG